MIELKSRDVIARRLVRSHLVDPVARARLVDTVRNVALQAQVLSAAEIGVRVRVRDVTTADLRRELYERPSLVKTWSLRGTMHAADGERVLKQDAKGRWESEHVLPLPQGPPARVERCRRAVLEIVG